jgi:NAD(P)-dependent dehydrogenase (short-subunit alcohol dehydrogenase family)
MSEPRNALVTGCSTGIGRAVVLDLLAQGWRVFATVRNLADADALLAAATAAAQSARLSCILLDVTQQASVQAGLSQVAEALAGAPLHGLVQNAGIANICPLEVMPLEFFRHQLEVNLTGVLSVTQAALPLMRQGNAPRGSRRIVVISSISGQIGTPLSGAYCASKFGLEGMSDVLRRELLPQGIDVTLVEPGAIATAIWQTSKRRAEDMSMQIQDHPAMPLYQDFADSMMERVGRIEGKATPAERVAQVVRRALQHRRPRVRARVGNDAMLGSFLARFLPTRWFDKLIVQDMTKHETKGK